MKSSRADLLLLANLVATLVMTGLIWFVQIVHYPLFMQVGAEHFADYEARHRMLTSWVVGPPMLVEAITGLLLLFDPPPVAKRWQLFAGIALLAVLWISTAFIQVPCHEVLSRGYDPIVAAKLVASNWLRTGAWTLRGILVLTMVRQRMR